MPYLNCQYRLCHQSFYVKPSRLKSRHVQYHSRVCLRLAQQEEIANRREKTCRLCNYAKPLNQFHVSTTRADGRQTICIDCTSTRDKAERRARGLKLPDHPHLAIDPDTGRFISVVPLIDRFWSYVDQSAGPDACWPWTGALDDHGYGILTIRKVEQLPHGFRPRKNDLYLAPRLSYTLLIGPIPDGLDILHSCDNPPCVNAYAHLRPGTDAENTADSVMRDRDAHGERNGNAKLTEVQAREIFSLHGQYSSLTVAPWYSVHPGTIQSIWNKITWKHIHRK